MRILTVENKPYELNHIPGMDEDIRYCVLDCTDPKEIDFYFIPLMLLETFSAPAVVLEIGKYKISVPVDLSMLYCDEEYSDLEVIELIKFKDKPYFSPIFNPLSHAVPFPEEIYMTDAYSEVKWFVPKLKPGHVLVIPLEDKPKPNCALFVKDANKIQTPIDVAELFQ